MIFHIPIRPVPLRCQGVGHIVKADTTRIDCICSSRLHMHARVRKKMADCHSQQQSIARERTTIDPER